MMDAVLLFRCDDIVQMGATGGSLDSDVISTQEQTSTDLVILLLSSSHRVSYSREITSNNNNNKLYYWYGRLVGHQLLVVYLCVCVFADMSPYCSAHDEWLIMKLCMYVGYHTANNVSNFCGEPVTQLNFKNVL